MEWVSSRGAAAMAASCWENDTHPHRTRADIGAEAGELGGQRGKHVLQVSLVKLPAEVRRGQPSAKQMFHLLTS